MGLFKKLTFAHLGDGTGNWLCKQNPRFPVQLALPRVWPPCVCAQETNSYQQNWKNRNWAQLWKQGEPRTERKGLWPPAWWVTGNTPARAGRPSTPVSFSFSKECRSKLPGLCASGIRGERLSPRLRGREARLLGSREAGAGPGLPLSLHLQQATLNSIIPELNNPGCWLDKPERWASPPFYSGLGPLHVFL